MNDLPKPQPTPERKIRQAKFILWLGIALIIIIGLAVAVYFLFIKTAGQGNVNVVKNVNTVNTNTILNNNSVQFSMPTVETSISDLYQENNPNDTYTIMQMRGPINTTLGYYFALPADWKTMKDDVTLDNTHYVSTWETLEWASKKIGAQLIIKLQNPSPYASLEEVFQKEILSLQTEILSQYKITIYDEPALLIKLKSSGNENWQTAYTLHNKKYFILEFRYQPNSVSVENFWYTILDIFSFNDKTGTEVRDSLSWESDTPLYESSTFVTNKDNKKEWWLVKDNKRYQITDWLTGLSWGLLINDAIEMTPDQSSRFFSLVGYSGQLKYEEGTYRYAVDKLWLGKSEFNQNFQSNVQLIAEYELIGNQFGAFHGINPCNPKNKDIKDIYCEALSWLWTTAPK